MKGSAYHVLQNRGDAASGFVCVIDTFRDEGYRISSRSGADG